MILRYFLFGLYYILDAYYFILIVSIIISWIPGIRNSKFYRVIRGISDAYLGPFRGILVIGFLDFTPIIGFGIYNVILYFIRSLVLTL